jgi:hypothetical protein
MTMKRTLVLLVVVATATLAWGGGIAVARSTGTSARPTTALPSPGGRPLIAASQPTAGLPTLSENWSGYAVTDTAKFNYVHSEFVQPAIKCTGAPDRYTSNWVGLDGFTSDTVEQDGTAAWCGGPSNTTPFYKAWYEMYPANSYNVFSVQPGDLIDTSVDYAGGKYTLTVSDLSSHKSYSDVGTCSSCQRSSAEWIIERPAGCNRSETSCFLFALANFTSSIMSEDVAGITGGAVQGIGSYASSYPLYMIQPLKKGFITLDTVGPVDETTQSFTAIFDRSGQVTPITL